MVFLPQCLILFAFFPRFRFVFFLSHSQSQPPSKSSCFFHPKLTLSSSYFLFFFFSLDSSRKRCKKWRSPTLKLNQETIQLECIWFPRHHPLVNHLKGMIVEGNKSIEFVAYLIKRRFRQFMWWQSGNYLLREFPPTCASPSYKNFLHPTTKNRFFAFINFPKNFLYICYFFSHSWTKKI